MRLRLGPFGVAAQQAALPTAGPAATAWLLCVPLRAEDVRHHVSARSPVHPGVRRTSALGDGQQFIHDGVDGGPCESNMLPCRGQPGSAFPGHRAAIPRRPRGRDQSRVRLWPPAAGRQRPSCWPTSKLRPFRSWPLHPTIPERHARNPPRTDAGLSPTRPDTVPSPPSREPLRAVPVPVGRGPRGRDLRELLVGRAPQRTTLRHALNLLVGAAVRYRDRSASPSRCGR